MSDPFETYVINPQSPGTAGRIVSPGNTDLDPVAKAITTLTAGDVTLLPVSNADADALSYVDLPAGWVSPYRVRRVTAATATVATVEG